MVLNNKKQTKLTIFIILDKKTHQSFSQKNYSFFFVSENLPFHKRNKRCYLYSSKNRNMILYILYVNMIICHLLLHYLLYLY